MKKLAALFLLICLTTPAFAEGFVNREAERSGASGTCKAIGNSVSGFFSSFGTATQDAFRRFKKEKK